MKLNNFWKLIISFLVVSTAAAVGSLATFSQIPTWYATLNRTILTPPNWVFGPAWTILYIMMATAVFIIWKQGTENPAVRHRLILFGEQLVLNAMWSIIFFGQHQILLAFVAIVVLWFTILVMVIKFYQLSKTAAYLLIPYLLWVSFASILNFVTWMANR